MLKVFLTVDTEVWPTGHNQWPHTPLSSSEVCDRELGAYFWGETDSTPLGLPYQLDTLRRCELKATYFVEPLFSYALGLEALQKVVFQVQMQGQEIGLHLHPEWLTDPRCRGLPGFAGPLLQTYNAEDQSTLVRAGLDRLKEAGATNPVVFRAGSWGANQETLNALAKNGLRLDTSLNAAFRQSFPDLPNRQTLQSPTQCGLVWEFPVTHFFDESRRGIRPLHVTACSFDEFRFVIDSAIAQGRSTLVVVFHSFEFVRVAGLTQGRFATPQRLLARRFERLCQYLAAHNDVLETSHFRDIRIPDLDLQSNAAPIRSSLARTMLRNAQQALSHVY